MKSTRNNTIPAVKRPNLGHIPLFVSVAHRHLEKEQAVGEKFMENTTYQVPVDLLRLTIPEEMLDGIKEVVFTYRRRA